MKFRSLVVVVTATLVTAAIGVSTPAQATPDPTPPPSPWAIPTEIPSATTPGITVGSKAIAFAEVGNKIYAVGPFTEVGGQARSGVAAFDRVTGALDATFNPAIVGQVYAVTPGPTSNTLYVAGSCATSTGSH